MPEARARVNSFIRRLFWFVLGTVVVGFIEANFHPGERLAVAVYQSLVAWGQRPMGFFWVVLLIALLVGILLAAVDPVRQLREWRPASVKKVRELIDAAVEAERSRAHQEILDRSTTLEAQYLIATKELEYQLEREKVRLASVSEIERVKELWQWEEMNCCGIVVELLRDVGRERKGAGDLTPGPWFEAADELVGASHKLWNLLDKPTESSVTDVYDALWRTLAAYGRGVCLVNRARIHIANVVPYLNRADEDRRLQRWHREHHRIARVSRCLRGRLGDHPRMVAIHPNPDLLRFDDDASKTLPQVTP